MTSRYAVTTVTSFLFFMILASNLSLTNSTSSQQLLIDESVNTIRFEDNVLTENFTIVVLPDTQGYTQDYPWIFDNQTKWIVENIESLNIVFVTQLGDLVNIPYNMTQWENANKSLSILEGNVPWAISPGNHDELDGNYEMYNKYFGYYRFCNETWYAGTYLVGDNTNSYQLFSAGGDDYLIFHLQYDPSDDVLLWASTVIDQYPNRRVIVSTHDYIQGPVSPDCRSGVGERIWHTFIKPHSDQIFLVLCGHASTQSTLVETVNGNIVYQLLSDYQHWNDTKSGSLRILTFCPKQDKIFVKTYSPYLNEYRTDPVNDFSINYDMTGATISISSNFNVSKTVFDELSKQIRFEISGETTDQGYCNVTIPKSFLSGNPWTVTTDKTTLNYIFSENATHTSLQFDCVCSGTVQVEIEGTTVIPEFSRHFLLLGVLTAFVTILLRQQKHAKQPVSNN